MQMTNRDIYNYALKLNEAFNDKEQTFPIKVNFYLQKNKKLLIELATDIEESRANIIKQYGQLNEEQGLYVVPTENLEVAQAELDDLYNLEQEVNIYTIDIDSFPQDMNVTSAQMEALMFMIN
jgi:hypothetical protein